MRIHEVGPRDGLQNEKSAVSTDVKAEFIRRLAGAGLTTVEATSFVHPKWVPQLADAERLFPLVSSLAGVRLPVLVPNDRGLDRALGLGAREIAVFASATESFAKANLNRTVDEALAMFEPVVTRAVEHGLRVRGYLSMCFGDPWEGAVPVGQVVNVCRRLIDMGCDELSLGDTIGVATAGHVGALLTALNDAGVATGTARGPLPRHLRPGARQHPRRAPARRDHCGRLRGRPRRLPVRQERHRKPRHRRPRVDARRPRCSHRRGPGGTGRNLAVDGGRAKTASTSA